MSYHILNSIWISVFPLLAVALILIVICYLICCLKRIKSKLNERNKFIKYMKNNIENGKIEPQQQHLQHNHRVDGNKSITTTSCKERVEENENLMLKIDINEIYVPPPRSQTLSRKKFIQKTNSPYNHYNSESKRFKSMNEIRYLEQLEVKELNESPKSLHTRFKSLLQQPQQPLVEQQQQQQPLQQNQKQQLNQSDNIRQQATQTDFFFDDKKNTNSKRFKRYGGSKTAPTTPQTKKSNIKIKKPQKYVKNSSSKSTFYSSSSSSSLLSSSSSLFHVQTKILTTSHVNFKNLSPPVAEKTRNSRIKLSLKRFSDIDNEDDVIFNDEDDSLSSTGVCVHKTNEIMKRSNSKLSQRNSLIVSNQSFTNLIAADTANNNKKTNQDKCSKSSIEPDENILNDILIKSNNKINESTEVVQSD